MGQLFENFSFSKSKHSVAGISMKQMVSIRATESRAACIWNLEAQEAYWGPMTGVWVKNCESVVVICRRCRDLLFWSSWAPNPSSRFCSSWPSRKLNWRYPNICKAACARVPYWCTLGANLVGLEQPPVPVACGDTVFWLWKTEIFEKLSHCTNSTANTGLGKSFSDVIGRFLVESEQICFEGFFFLYGTISRVFFFRTHHIWGELIP